MQVSTCIRSLGLSRTLDTTVTFTSCIYPLYSHSFLDILLNVSVANKRSNSSHSDVRRDVRHDVTSDVHSEVMRRFVKHEQRYTSQRRLIVTVLSASDHPLMIPQMLKRSSNVKKVLAQSSLYRNLVVLENVGVVQRIFSTDDVARYELNDDILGHHHHLVCSKCGDIRDVRIPESLESSLDSTLSKIAKSSGFQLDQHRLDLIGRCGNCR